MATSKTSPKDKHAAPVQIDCEVCRNYTGSAYAFRFACTQGHCQEKTWTLKREACPDFSLMTRKEQILKRFEHSAKYYGERDIKKHRSEVRRMVTGLQKTLESFGKFMTLEQIDAMKAAAHHLGALGDDLELAGRLAVQVQKEAEAERQRKERERRAALVERHIGGMAEGDCIALCQDLIAFDSFDSKDWLRNHKRDPEAFVLIDGISNLENALHSHRRAPSPATLAGVREAGALCIESLQERKYSRSYATWADFEAFRVWRNEISAAIAKAAGRS